MRLKPMPKEEKDPEVFLRHALVLTQCQPTADEDEIESAIRAYGKAVAKAERRKAAPDLYDALERIMRYHGASISTACTMAADRALAKTKGRAIPVQK